MLSPNPSKAEELAHWRAFVEALPRNCYLADLLAGLDETLEDRMRSDLGIALVDEWREAQRDILQARAEVKTEKDRLEELLKQQDAAISKASAMQSAIANTANEVRDLISDLQRVLR